MIYNLSKTKNHPLYEELYMSLKKDINSGKLYPGSKLPSRRNMARDLGISVVTVDTAFEQLMAEGYIYPITRKGYYVSDVLTSEIPVKAKKHISNYTEEMSDMYKVDMISNIPSKHFPFTIWSRIMRGVILDEENGFMKSMPTNGIVELRRAISDYLYRSKNITISPSQIVVGAGAEYLYRNLVLLLGKSRKFGVEDPGYPKISDVYRLCGADVEYLDLDDSGLSIGSLNKSNVDIVHLSPAHHYPTGIVMPIARRREISEWASKKDTRYIIEDDYDSELRFSGRPLPTMYSSDENSQIIYINTFSQTISPSLRISYMCLPKKLMRIYKDKMGFLSCTVPYFDQLTLARFISEGYFERHISRMKNYYRHERNKILKTLETSPFSSKIRIIENNAGLHFLAVLSTDTDDDTIKKNAARRGINISFLSDYLSSPQKKDQHILVINYASLDPDVFPDVIETISGLI